MERGTYAMRMRDLVETIVTDGRWEFEIIGRRNRVGPQRVTGDAIVGFGLVINSAY